jgi:hypothetical protein
MRFMDRFRIDKGTVARQRTIKCNLLSLELVMTPTYNLDNYYHCCFINRKSKLTVKWGRKVMGPANGIARLPKVSCLRFFYYRLSHN